MPAPNMVSHLTKLPCVWAVLPIPSNPAASGMHPTPKAHPRALHPTRQQPRGIEPRSTSPSPRTNGSVRKERRVSSQQASPLPPYERAHTLPRTTTTTVTATQSSAQGGEPWPHHEPAQLNGSTSLAKSYETRKTRTKRAVHIVESHSTTQTDEHSTARKWTTSPRTPKAEATHHQT